MVCFDCRHGTVLEDFLPVLEKTFWACWFRAEVPLLRFYCFALYFHAKNVQQIVYNWVKLEREKENVQLQHQFSTQVQSWHFIKQTIKVEINFDYHRYLQGHCKTNAASNLFYESQSCFWQTKNKTDFVYTKHYLPTGKKRKKNTRNNYYTEKKLDWNQVSISI